MTPVNFPPNLELSGVADLLQQGDIEGGLGQVEIQWSRQYTDFWGQQVNAEGHDAAGIRQMLVEIARQTGQRTALIYAIAQPNQLDLIVQTGTGEPIYHHVDVDRTTLITTARALRTTITNPLLQSSDQYLDAAQQLYQWLVAPLIPDLEAAQIKTLLFSPDGGLRSLPFAALHDGQQFLIERFGVAMTPSINLTDTRYAPLTNAAVLAMGASEFETLTPLPAVPVELQAIATQSPSGTTFLNEQFTVANLRQARSHNLFQVVHLATHGDFQANHPSGAFIQFWGSEQLTLDRLRDLGLGRPQVDLLVLSACRTAVGNFEAELGFAGLAVQSGVKSVLASLWSVDDAGTLALMNEFYRQLRQTSTKAEALRQAQLALLHGQVRIELGYVADMARGQRLALPTTGRPSDRTLAHPYYWSAFTLIGSPW
jgi:CHAT domain-containing protein